MEKWITENVLQIAIIVLGGVIAVIKLSATQSETRNKINEHLMNPSPHPSCPIHGQAISNVGESLNEIKDRLASIEEFLRNGRGK